MGGGGRGVVIFADSIIARQRGEADRWILGVETRLFFLVRTDKHSLCWTRAVRR